LSKIVARGAAMRERIAQTLQSMRPRGEAYGLSNVSKQFAARGEATRKWLAQRLESIRPVADARGWCNSSKLVARSEAMRESIAQTLQSIRLGDIAGAGERRHFQIGIVLFVIAALVPLVAGGYALQLSISIVMYTALATSWLLFSGPTNYIALSTAAFFGIGMYTVAGGIDAIPYPLLIVLAGLAGAALAAIVGLATLRVSGVYFVIFSLGLAELVRQIMTWLQHVLGTMSGIYVLLDRSENVYYWELLLLAAVVYLVGWWIGRSRLGFALRIIGNDEVVAVHCGINTARAKVVLFVISSTFAAIAGALVAPRWSYVEPGVAFSPFLSFQVVIMALLGGTHRLWGPLLGVIPFVLLWEVISINFPNQTTLLLGACFLLIVYVIPNGITGLAERAFGRRAILPPAAREHWQRGLDAATASLKHLQQRWNSRNA
jgi:branched-chain amino acid transport system permease protein